MEKIKKAIFESEAFQKLGDYDQQLTPDNPLFLRGVAGSLLAFVAAQIFERSQRQVLLISSDVEKAEKLRDDCSLLLGESCVCYFGARPVHHAQSLDLSTSIAQVEALKVLSTGSIILTIASPQSIVEKVPHLDDFKKNIIELHSGKEYSFSNLIQNIEHLGFARKDFVEQYGDIAVRGGIVDIFPFVGENPIRVEFWGDTIESIREFDVLSQRSIKELQATSIVPSLSPDSTDFSETSQITDSADTKLVASLFDYLQRDAIIILDEPALIEKEIEELFKEGGTNLFSYSETTGRVSSFQQVVNGYFESSGAHIPSPRLTGGQVTSQIVLDFGSTPQPSFNGSIKHLAEYSEKLAQQDYSIFLTSDTQTEATRLRELLEETTSSGNDEESGEGGGESMTYGDDLFDKQEHREVSRDQNFAVSRDSRFRPEFLTESVHSGFVYPSANLAVFTEHEIFNRLKRRGGIKRRRFKGLSQKELQQLKEGDFVVHVDYGIGKFEGLKKMKVGGVEQEVIKVQFAEEDALYVNLNFITRVQKYSSQDGHVPKLNRLGSAEWEKMKARAKRRIKDIARDIIAIYAKRKLEQGFAFAPDTHWQRELEASFMYEDTADQAQATLDVKKDMENSSPMDRLVCGDVGFGKTEVAVRAAFKAVMDGKQVAVLVPTTILALQHFNTFRDRLSPYTTRVENITRFKSPKEQKQIVAGLQGGSVDIIIGTHRLLSKDIAFKDLGLLVVDEEHRFGVSAKERLRKLKASVDTLALTATPIPRTLHFSLIGARDLSLIATAPRNRIPIITEIIPADSRVKEVHWQVIREAIVRELHRGGQIYFVHDRVSNIGAIAEEVKKHVPEAKVHVAHGQMSGHELEKTMLDFLERKYDVLICTKIIESGLDIPSVNTIIINRADMFGLAELYQLRGRVGRSNIQAYAYLLTPPLAAMPKTTLRRLQAIEEFTELGSGFNLAMRDLEIRGAGNLLGGEQSGFIMEMGFEMYERIVREAVEELRDEELTPGQDQQPASQISHPKPADTLLDADIDALIPDLYIESDAERLDVYRRLYKATTKEELEAMRLELKDRFGEYPEEVENMFQLIELRLIASGAGFPKISLRGGAFSITMPGESDERFYGRAGDSEAPFQKMMRKIAVKEIQDVQLKQDGKELVLRCSFHDSLQPKGRIVKAKEKLKQLTNAS